MPIYLVNTTDGTEIHGATDQNAKKTACGIKFKTADMMNLFVLGKEMRDLKEITCDECKIYLAKKMIKESKKDEAKQIREEKKNARGVATSIDYATPEPKKESYSAPRPVKGQMADTPRVLTPAEKEKREASGEYIPPSLRKYGLPTETYEEQQKREEEEKNKSAVQIPLEPITAIDSEPVIAPVIEPQAVPELPSDDFSQFIVKPPSQGLQSEIAEINAAPIKPIMPVGIPGINMAGPAAMQNPIAPPTPVAPSDDFSQFIVKPPSQGFQSEVAAASPAPVKPIIPVNIPGIDIVNPAAMQNPVAPPIPVPVAPTAPDDFSQFIVQPPSQGFQSEVAAASPAPIKPIMPVNIPGIDIVNPAAMQNPIAPPTPVAPTAPVDDFSQFIVQPPSQGFQSEVAAVSSAPVKPIIPVNIPGIDIVNPAAQNIPVPVVPQNPIPAHNIGNSSESSGISIAASQGHTPSISGIDVINGPSPAAIPKAPISPQRTAPVVPSADDFSQFLVKPQSTPYQQPEHQTVPSEPIRTAAPSIVGIPGIDFPVTPHPAAPAPIAPPPSQKASSTSRDFDDLDLFITPITPSAGKKSRTKAAKPGEMGTVIAPEVTDEAMAKATHTTQKTVDHMLSAPTTTASADVLDPVKHENNYMRSVPTSPTRSAPISQAPAPMPIPQAPAPMPVSQAPAPMPVSQAPAPMPIPQAPAPMPVSQAPVPMPVSQASVPTPIPQAPVPMPVPQAPVNPYMQNAHGAPQPTMPTFTQAPQNPYGAPAMTNPFAQNAPQSPQFPTQPVQPTIPQPTQGNPYMQNASAPSFQQNPYMQNAPAAPQNPYGAPQPTAPQNPYMQSVPNYPNQPAPQNPYMQNASPNPYMQGFPQTGMPGAQPYGGPSQPARPQPVAPKPGVPIIASLDDVEKTLNALAGKPIDDAKPKEAEVVVPTFTEYIPPSKKAAEQKKKQEAEEPAPPPRPLTAAERREAKKKAKLDAEFQKELEKKGFLQNPKGKR